MNKNKILYVKNSLPGAGIYRNDKESVSPSELNLPESLSENFNKWSQWHWDYIYHNDDFNWNELVAYGRCLAFELKYFLGNDYKIFFKDEEINFQYWYDYVELAEFERKEGDREEATKFYISAIELDAPKGELYFKIGTLYIDLEKKEKAIEYFLKCLEYDPENSPALNNLGLAYSELEEYELGVKYLLKAAEFCEDEDTRSKIYFNIGLKYYATQLYDEAVGYFTQSLNIVPEDASSLLYLAFSYQLANNIEESRDTFKKLIACDPENSEHYFDLAMIEIQEYNNIEAGIELLEKAIKINPNDPVAYYNLAFAHYNNNDFDSVTDVFLRAIQKDPNLTKHFYDTDLILDPRIDYLKIRDAMKEAAKVGDERAEEWVRENVQYLKGVNIQDNDTIKKSIQGEDRRSNLKLLKL